MRKAILITKKSNTSVLKRLFQSTKKSKKI